MGRHCITILTFNNNDAYRLKNRHKKVNQSNNPLNSLNILARLKTMSLTTKLSRSTTLKATPGSSSTLCRWWCLEPSLS